MKITRRDVLKAGVAAGLAGAVGCSTSKEPDPAPERWTSRTTPPMPSVYLSHGSPMEALAKDDYAAALAAFGGRVKPDAIVIISAHYLAPAPVRVTTSAKPETIYDFGGFPKKLYEVVYPCPGHPALANEIVAMLRDSGLHAEAEAERGLDHGSWVPLRLSYPEATTPIVTVSLPALMEPTDLVELGRQLAPLRTKGVMLIGSGGLVHNFQARTKGDQPESWAADFEAWVMERARALDARALTDYREKAPNAELAAPTTEHFDPIFVALGAAKQGDTLKEIFTGFRKNDFSLKCFSVES